MSSTSIQMGSEIKSVESEMSVTFTDYGPNSTMLADLDELREDTSPAEVEKAINKYSGLISSFSKSLKPTDGKTTNLWLNFIDELMKKAWSVPSHGFKFELSLSNVLRENGGLDSLIYNLTFLTEEQQFTSARILEQCLTTENCDYLVEKGLEKVVRVATQYSNNKDENHSRVGTGILERLLKHSETTCSDVIRLEGLDAILDKCQGTDVETLRHCAGALANLSLFGGSENQQLMIIRKVHIWLFPLAFHNDDNIKYYACLAAVTLLANKEIEAAVLQSGTLNLVESFIMSRKTEEFVITTEIQACGQSKSWLQRLVLVLNSRRQEARSLAAFHFSIEVGIKKKHGNTDIFHEIGAIEPLKKVASSPNAIASKYAAKALRLIDEEVPYKLSQQVPIWMVEDVVEWLKQIGFFDLIPHFVSNGVDGDLLLQLTEETLKDDIGVTKGIQRKRFIRELELLKEMADYSSCDPTNLNNFLQSIDIEYSRYTYVMLRSGLNKDTLKFVTEDELNRKYHIDNGVHRNRILSAIRDGPSNNESTNFDAFISYRQSNGSHLASLVACYLRERKYSVFVDVKNLEAGQFPCQLERSVRQSKCFLLILTPNALDRCIGDNRCKDWVHKEIVVALQSQRKIIPIVDNFQWPEADQLPKDIRVVSYFNGVSWSHDYHDACVEKLERFMQEEYNLPSEELSLDTYRGQSDGINERFNLELDSGDDNPFEEVKSAPHQANITICDENVVISNENVLSCKENITIRDENLVICNENLTIRDANLAFCDAFHTIHDTNLMMCHSNLKFCKENHEIHEANLAIYAENLIIDRANLTIRCANLTIRDANLMIRDSNFMISSANHGTHEENLLIREANIRIRNANDRIREASITILNANDKIRDAKIRIRDANLIIRATNLSMLDANLKMNDANLRMYDANLKMTDANLKTYDANLRMNFANLRMYDANLSVSNLNLWMCGENPKMNGSNVGIINSNFKMNDPNDPNDPNLGINDSTQNTGEMCLTN